MRPDREDVVKYSYYFAGIVGLLGVFNLMSYNEKGIADGIFTVGFAICFFIIGRLLAQGRVISLYLLGLATITSLVYGYMMGRSGNFVLFAVGVVWFVWLYRFWKNGELK